MNAALSPDAVLEAALLTHDEALSEQQLQQLCPELLPEQLSAHLHTVQQRWQGRALALVRQTAGWRFQIRPSAMDILARLHPQKPPRYSRAVLETLAVIAYRQPVTRGDIEAVRGVAVSANIMNLLQERGWIAAAGRRDSIGKPTLWMTTPHFLHDFQLGSLNDLPPLADLGHISPPPLSETPL